MSWKDILKAEKAHCGSEKLDEEEKPSFEKLIGNQDRKKREGTKKGKQHIPTGKKFSQK